MEIEVCLVWKVLRKIRRVSRYRTIRKRVSNCEGKITMSSGNKAMVIRNIATGLKRKATKPNINAMVSKNKTTGLYVLHKCWEE